jgi:hypothetical protein
MATFEQWEIYFRKLPTSKLRTLRGALGSLNHDPMFKREYGEMGLVQLANMIEAILNHERGSGW